tara:strand:- start:1485 stop:1802 length:318 start_codon:yes stop_codon:yes gene_type:complete
VEVRVFSTAPRQAFQPFRADPRSLFRALDLVELEWRFRLPIEIAKEFFIAFLRFMAMSRYRPGPRRLPPWKMTLPALCDHAALFDRLESLAGFFAQCVLVNGLSR